MISFLFSFSSDLDFENALLIDVPIETAASDMPCYAAGVVGMAVAAKVN